MPVNIKKRTAHNIFFGLDAVTEQTRYISEVVSGAKCGCICPLCKTPLEARKGAIRRHHFAHDTNYDCMYANEAAVYKRVSEILEREKLLLLPDVTLRFENWKDAKVLKERQALQIDRVSYQCELKQYPPELVVEASGSKLRILIEFSDKYYSEEDLIEIAEEGKEQGYSALLLNMPKFIEENEDYYTMEHLTASLTQQGVQGIWIHSALEIKWRKRYLNLVIEPKRLGEWVSCPLHRTSGGAPEPFYVGHWLCSRCDYCLEDGMCIGASGILEPSDFDLTPEVLLSRVRELQKKNEKDDVERQRIQEENRLRDEMLRKHRQKALDSAIRIQKDSDSEPVTVVTTIPKSAVRSMHEEALYFMEHFDGSGSEPSYDAYERRWLKCKKCGKPKLENDFMKIIGPNLGVCKNCWKSGMVEP